MLQKQDSKKTDKYTGFKKRIDKVYEENNGICYIKFQINKEYGKKVTDYPAYDNIFKSIHAKNILKDREIVIAESNSKFDICIRVDRSDTRIIDFVLRINYDRENYFKNGYSFLERELGLFHYQKPTKEITESGGTLKACFKALKILKMGEMRENKNVLCFVIADGKVPRTGILTLYSTKWNIIVTDPVMTDKWTHGEMKNYSHRLKCFNSLAENLCLPDINNCPLIVILAVHSHANLQSFHDRLSSKYNLPIITSSLPCCKGYVHTLNQKPLLEFNDNGIFSVKNKILVYDYNVDT